jgi:hypothetical protein
MLTPLSTVAVELMYKDNDGGQAKVTIRLPFGASRDTALAAGQTIAGAISALSDALLVSITARYNLEDTSPDAPGILSNVGYYLCLYYSNDLDTEPVFVPSPNPAVLETTGSFAGIRLDLSNPAVVALADALTDALAETLGPDASPWNRWLERGGRTL